VTPAPADDTAKGGDRAGIPRRARSGGRRQRHPLDRRDTPPYAGITDRGEVAIDTPIRILVAKVGLDGHDRGAKVVARTLRDAGMDVIYTGLHRTPEEIVAAAVQEDVDVVGVSLLSGAHLTLVPRVVDGLRREDAADVLVVVGGVVPDEDVPLLRERGVAAVFGQETSPDAIVAGIRALVAARQVG
jgi:methylmalonyl-CoA mutase C-terminal domain/subunit